MSIEQEKSNEFRTTITKLLLEEKPFCILFTVCPKCKEKQMHCMLF